MVVKYAISASGGHLGRRSDDKSGMPLSRHRAKRLGREHGRKGVEQAQDAARDFLRIALAEGIYELEKGDLSNDGFDELLMAAARKMPAVVQAAARRAVYDAIRETDPSSYSIILNESDDHASDLAAGAGRTEPRGA